MDTARSAPAAQDPGADFEVGVCDDSFQVYARIILRGADGGRRLESSLADMGFELVSSGSSERTRGCDLLMARRAAEPALALR